MGQTTAANGPVAAVGLGATPAIDGRPTRRPATGTAGGAEAAPAAGGAEAAPGKTAGVAALPPAVRTAGAWSWHAILIALAVAGAVWVAGALEVILVPIAVALLFTVLLTPVKRFARRFLRFGDGLAAGFSLAVLVLVVGGLIALAGRSITRGFRDLQGQAAEGFDTFVNWLADGPLKLDSDRITQYTDSLSNAVSDNQSTLISGAVGAATTVSHFFAGTLIALFCTFFFLHDGRRIWSWLVGLLPARSRDRVHQAGRRGLVTLSAYVRTQILVAFVDAVGIGIGAAILRVPLALPLAILVFVGSFVPIVGAVVTGAIAVLVALVANGWVSALLMLGVVLLVQQVESHGLQPFLMGHAVSLHPVAVLLVVAAGSFAAGIVGALFAVPLAAVLNTVILYLNGHDKFPELGTGDKIIARARPAPAPAVAAAESDVGGAG